MNVAANDNRAPRAPDHPAIALAAACISQADSLVIAAGAGMGVDSGLPDFRGNAGFWKAYPALAEGGTGFKDIASPAAFHATPRRAWGFYGHRLALYRNAMPHTGYQILRQWGESMPHGFFVFTSNVDGHFQKAGFDPLQVDECHGSIHSLQCLEPCSAALWPAEEFAPLVDEPQCELISPLPTCPRCGGTARPNILMFNDSAWIDTRHETQAIRRHAFLERARRPVIIEIGAGLNIPTVRYFSEQTVLPHHGMLIRINPREAAIGTVPGVSIDGGALKTLTAIDALLRPK